ncbi:L,D-transpeptidase family protein [Flavobacterium ardleyense]|uniref:L,D-transpeptidase family protein n=1 Tax=Flavobacterium ardleyense TaxID=2038737 RepID=UPI00298CFB29|nr:L,D-transpeptidase family protein [Flavobacterium ardleyense]
MSARFHFLYFLLASFLLVTSCKKKDSANLDAKAPIEYSKKAAEKFVALAIDSTSLAGESANLLFDLYKKNNFTTIWNLTSQRQNVLNSIASCGSDGLNPEDYHLKKLSDKEGVISSASEKERIEYDIELSAAAQKFLSHLSNGKLNPKKLYSDWEIKRNKYDINAHLYNAIKGDSILEAVASATPQHQVYKSLKQALKILETFPDQKFSTIKSDQKIQLNDSVKDLITIKKKLIYWKDLQASAPLSPVYDTLTYKALKRFQVRHGLSADGVIGRGTIAALNETKQDRESQIIANMERWRWYRRSFGDYYIILNIADYKMRVVKNNDTINTRRVAVGTIKRKTPILTSKLSDIVINPTWTVPPTILKEDLVPSARNNRSYFARTNISIFDWSNNPISPENWDPDNYTKYRYVQGPGDNNSLGNVKFNFPNSHMVYLHDTNHKNIFSRNNRSLSSGCVRVENPLPLAEMLLNNSRWSLDSIKSTISRLETTSVKMKDPVYIYQYYWTAWSENGQLIFRDDIYNLDKDLSKKLRN